MFCSLFSLHHFCWGFSKPESSKCTFLTSWFQFLLHSRSFQYHLIFTMGCFWNSLVIPHLSSFLYLYSRIYLIYLRKWAVPNIILVTIVAHQLLVLQITALRVTHKHGYIISSIAFQHFYNALLPQTRKWRPSRGCMNTLLHGRSFTFRIQVLCSWFYVLNQVANFPFGM